jgi:hypothetical protein
MRVYQFRQFRIGHESLFLRIFANLSSVLGNIFSFGAASNIAALKTREVRAYQFAMHNTPYPSEILQGL